jgi:hypothetical protein
LAEKRVLPLERKGRKSVAWSRTGVMALIRSRVYRGGLWDRDELVCEDAHKAIVTEPMAARAAGRQVVKDRSRMA